MLDLGPATDTLIRLVTGVPDDQLQAPTPCTQSTVGDLLDHIDGLCMAFTEAATKQVRAGGSQAPSADASRLGPDWRTRIAGRLAELAQVWRAEPAWTGMTEAGGIPVPGELAGVIATNEVIVHGWDVAVPADASKADRLIAPTGRDPSWRRRTT